MMKKYQGRVAVALAASTLLLASCGGRSDAERIIEANNSLLMATINYYEAMGPTMTSAAVFATAQYGTMAAELDRSRQEVRALTARLNSASSGVPAVVPGSNNGAVTPVANNPPVNGTPIAPPQGGTGFGSFPTATIAPTQAPVPDNMAAGGGASSNQAPSGLRLEGIVTAPNFNDDDGCPLNPTNTFAANTERIYVIAMARNYEQGTTFTTKWTGPNEFDQTYTWTTEEAGQDMCVRFYVEPVTLQLAAGTYTIQFSASDSTGAAQGLPITFTIQ
jgi:hypothetical protein